MPPPPPPPPPPPSSLSCPPGCVLSSKCGEKKNWGTVVAEKAERPEVRGRTVAVNRAGPQLNMDEILGKKLKPTGRSLFLKQEEEEESTTEEEPPKRRTPPPVAPRRRGPPPTVKEEEEFGFGPSYVEEEVGGSRKRRKSMRRKSSTRKHKKHKSSKRKHKKRTHKKRRV